MCGHTFKVLLSHLKLKHKLGAQEAKRLAGEKRLVKLGTSQKTSPVPCPHPGCCKMVVRVDRHLVNMHGMDKTDPDYIRMNEEVKGKRRQASMKKAAKKLSKPKPKRIEDLPWEEELEDTDVSLGSEEEEEDPLEVDSSSEGDTEEF